MKQLFLALIRAFSPHPLSITERREIINHTWQRNGYQRRPRPDVSNLFFQSLKAA